MLEFNTRVSEERKKTKKMSDGEYNINKDLTEVSEQLKKIDLEGLERRSQ